MKEILNRLINHDILPKEDAKQVLQSNRRFSYRIYDAKRYY